MILQHSTNAPATECTSSSSIRPGQRRRVLLVSALALLSARVYGQTVTTTLSTGSEPGSVSVNPVTNKIYIANAGSGTVTVLNGLTNDSATVPVGSQPFAVAVNPVTNKIYVANYGSATVTVIDGDTNTSSTVKVGSEPTILAINAATNKIYVAGYSSTLTVIDGANNTTTAVSVGSSGWVAVNPVTNTVYLAQGASSTLAVIDGASNTIKATLAVGQFPSSLAVNPATNKIYVASSGSQVTVVDGATNSTTTNAIAPGGGNASVAINPVTNKIYVSQQDTAIVTIIDGATNHTAGIPAGSVSIETGAGPAAVALNPTTNQIYVCNDNDKTVVIIDGATNATTALPVGANASALAVNPITNKIYVPNSFDNTVTVIDGATNRPQPIVSFDAPTAVAINPVTDKVYIGSSGSVAILDGTTLAATGIGDLGTGRASIAVNPVTNKIYVGFSTDQRFTVIDGATNSTTTLRAENVQSIAVNPVTDKIYVAEANGLVDVIDGATNAITSVESSPLGANSIAVNPATNKIYVANMDNQYITVIDGATNRTQRVANTGPYARDSSAVAVNPLTDKIYVANSGTANVTVIDGTDNSTTTVPTGAGPSAVTVNPVTNKIYVLNIGHFETTASDVTVIDGATDTAIVTLPVGSSPHAIVVNPVSNKIYVTDQDDVVVIDGATNRVTKVALSATATVMALNPVTNKLYVPGAGVIDDQQVQPSPLTSTITPLPGNETSSPNPSFTFSVHGTADQPTGVYFQVDTWQNAWTAATGSDSIYEGTVMTGLQPGFHILYAYAVDSSFLIGTIQAYEFLVHGFEVMPAATTTSLTVNPASSIFGLPVMLSATAKAATGIPSGAVYFSYGSTLLGTVFLDARGVATLTTAILPVGADLVTAAYVGSEANDGSSSSATATVEPSAKPTTLWLSPASGSGSQRAFTAVYSDPYGIADLGAVRLLINSSDSTLNGCYVFYSPSTNDLYMTDNAGNEAFAPFAPAPNSGSSAGNSQCTFNGCWLLGFYFRQHHPRNLCAVLHKQLHRSEERLSAGGTTERTEQRRHSKRNLEGAPRRSYCQQAQLRIHFQSTLA